MFQISKKTEYGLIAMRHMASQAEGTYSSAREIADRYHLSFDLVSKIMQKLKREGYVQSHQGILGGYSLAANLDQITLADFLAALDGPVGMIECSQGADSDTGPTCIQFNECTIIGPMRRLNTRVLDVLNATKLSDIIVDSPHLPKPPVTAEPVAAAKQ